MELSAHSDVLVHWTGKDIDERNVSKEQEAALYMERVKSCLRYGLWMKKEKSPIPIQINNQNFDLPSIARTCFTELKLSMSEDHAKRYGKLGIGVKRYFLFDRLGAPVNYYQSETLNLLFPPFSDAFIRGDFAKELLAFLKPMCSGRPLKYDIYNESEWRIVYSEIIKNKLINFGMQERTKLFINPQSTDNTTVREYYNNLGKEDRPDYLIPLDPWLAVIIYPSLRVKKICIENTEIRKLLAEISCRQTVTGCPEKGFMPIEMDLSVCKHF